MLLLVLVLAAMSDLKSRRISNRLILFGLTGGLIYRIGIEGAPGIVTFFIHISIPVILFYLLFLMRALGAGDIKLFSIISSICSYKELVYCMAAAFVIGAGMALLKMLYYKTLYARLSMFISYVQGMYQEKQFKQYSSGVRDSVNTIHFSVAILLGYLVSLGVYH